MSLCLQLSLRMFSISTLIEFIDNARTGKISLLRLRYLTVFEEPATFCLLLGVQSAFFLRGVRRIASKHQCSRRTAPSANGERPVLVAPKSKPTLFTHRQLIDKNLMFRLGRAVFVDCNSRSDLSSSTAAACTAVVLIQSDGTSSVNRSRSFSRRISSNPNPSSR
jgi:hypothetical protein